MRVHAGHDHGTAREGRGSGSQRSGARLSNLKGLSPRLLLQVPSRLELSCGPCAEPFYSGARLCAASGPAGATRPPPAPWRKPRAPGSAPPPPPPAAPRRRLESPGGQAQWRHHLWPQWPRSPDTRRPARVACPCQGPARFRLPGSVDQPLQCAARRASGQAAWTPAWRRVAFAFRSV